MKWEKILQHGPIIPVTITTPPPPPPPPPNNGSFLLWELNNENNCLCDPLWVVTGTPQNAYLRFTPPPKNTKLPLKLSIYGACVALEDLQKPTGIPPSNSNMQRQTRGFLLAWWSEQAKGI